MMYRSCGNRGEWEAINCICKECDKATDSFARCPFKYHSKHVIDCSEYKYTSKENDI